MSGFGALLGAGGSLLGGLLGGDGGAKAAARANAALNKQIQDLFREMGQREALNFREANKRFGERRDKVIGTIDRAAAGVGSSERSLRQGAVDRSSQSTANLTQSLAAKGFKNSTIGANLQRGVNTNLERNLSGITAQADRARTGIAQSKAGFQASVEGDIANLPLQQNSATSSRMQALARALQGMGHTAGPTNDGFSKFGGAFGSFLGNNAGGFGDLFSSFFSGGGSNLAPGGFAGGNLGDYGYGGIA